jgi:hypothetical protein
MTTDTAFLATNQMTYFSEMQQEANTTNVFLCWRFVCNMKSHLCSCTYRLTSVLVGLFVFVCKRNSLLRIFSRFCSADGPNNVFYVSMVFSLQVLIRCPRVTITCWDTAWCDYLKCLEPTTSRIAPTYIFKTLIQNGERHNLYKPTVIHSFIHSLSYDRSIASSKSSHPEGAI